MRTALTGCSAVIHLATGGTAWAGLLDADIVGLKVVADAALEHHASKLIYASSNHVVGMHEREALASGTHIEYSPQWVPRPDSPYGAAKAFGEAYCRYLAECTPLRVSCLRIGSLRRSDDIQSYAGTVDPFFDYIPGGADEQFARLQKVWLSHADLERTIGEELIAREKFRLRFAISDNRDAFWSREILSWDGREGEA
jgi:NAD+ dependent glucose-6-phosphate dehydrogenase